MLIKFEEEFGGDFGFCGPGCDCGNCCLMRRALNELLQKQEEETRREIFKELERFGIHLVNKIK